MTGTNPSVVPARGDSTPGVPVAHGAERVRHGVGRGPESLRQPTDAPTRTPPKGLTAAQVEQRVAAGQANVSAEPEGRTTGQIVRANILTPFNALITVLCLVVLATGQWQNALFGFVVVFNSAVGIFQELRARRTLSRLAVLHQQTAEVVRGGARQTIPVAEVVRDDLVQIRAGDQVPTDGTVLGAAGLEVDEALLTGESDPIPKAPGDQVRSGSFVVAGAGSYQATGVGDSSYAARLAAEAQKFKLTRSELQAGTNKLMRWISLVIALAAPVVVWRQFTSPDNLDWRSAVTASVAAFVGMIPDGLVLLTSMAFMLGVITLARQKTLVQELPAVEGLARVDAVCLDKTGTLTHNEMQLVAVERALGGGAMAPFPQQSRGAPPEQVAPALVVDDQRIGNALALLAAQSNNASSTAIAARYANPQWQLAAQVPFSSARKWAAAQATAKGAPAGTWVLGAPEMVLPGGPAGRGGTGAPAVAAGSAVPIGGAGLAGPAAESRAAPSPVAARAAALAASGNRVLLLATTTAPLPTGPDGRPAGQLPPGLIPAALVVLNERIRDDAADTLRFFTEQGVALYVISGDNPQTVGAVAAQVGVPGINTAADAFDARNLPTDPGGIIQVLRAHPALGRVQPAQKRAIVQALQAEGHVVAMTGDGVNDALALKDADIGVAMGEGSAATRAVAQLVLLDGKFSHLPEVVAQGRRVIANIERAANLFLVKNVYSFVLVAVTALTATAYPFEPIQLTLISAITIGIPGFFLALGPNRRRYVPGFLTRVLKFAVPAGFVVAAAAYASFEFSRMFLHNDIVAARTNATITTMAICLAAVVVVSRPFNAWKGVLVGVLAVLAGVAVALPQTGAPIFLLSVSAGGAALALAVGAVGAFSVYAIYQLLGLTQTSA